LVALGTPFRVPEGQTCVAVPTCVAVGPSLSRREEVEHNVQVGVGGGFPYFALLSYTPPRGRRCPPKGNYVRGAASYGKCCTTQKERSSLRYFVLPPSNCFNLRRYGFFVQI
jgi:hypothetical protein